MPAGCHLDAISRNMRVDEVPPSYAHLVTGLTLHHNHSEEYYQISKLNGVCMWSHRCLELRMRDVFMQSLKRLQLIMKDNTNFGEDFKKGELWLQFCPYMTPSLEVLEIDVQCNLGVLIDPALTLKSLILIAAGSLQVHELSDKGTTRTEVAGIPIVSQLYLHSSSAFLSRYRDALKVAVTGQCLSRVRLLEHVREERDSWTARMPASFQPGDIQECCCGACPECLVCAGLPILCDRAWTRAGFDKHLRPRHSAAASLGQMLQELITLAGMDNMSLNQEF